MKKKNILRYGLILGISAIVLASCEKAIDNSVPEGTPRRAFYNEQIKSYLTNDSIWITQKLDKNASLVLRVGFDFKNDDKVGLYRIQYATLTLVEELNLAKARFTTPAQLVEINSLINVISGLSDANARSALLTVPGNITYLNRFQVFFPVTAVRPTGKVTTTEGSNIFNVIGDFDSSLTFFNSSFLSDLKVSRTFDFDFLINKYNRDSLALTGYYSQSANRNPIIKPIAKSSLAPHFDALNIINVVPFTTEIKVNNQIVVGETATYFKSRFDETYDNLNKCLGLVVKSGQTLNPSFGSTNALVATEVTYKIGDPKPAAGTVIAKLKAYDSKAKDSITNGLNVEILVR